MNLKFLPSTQDWRHKGERTRTDGIVLHAMSGQIAEFTASEFLAKQMGYSIHALVHPTGLVEMGLDWKMKAIHAGKSEWKDWKWLNNNFLGVELLVDIVEKHPTNHKATVYDRFLYTIHETDWLSAKQLDAVVKLCQLWKTEFDIEDENIIEHWQCSGDDVRGKGKGKEDCGKMFPRDLFWKYMNGDGLYQLP